jgi:hypothetical protein
MQMPHMHKPAVIQTCEIVTYILIRWQCPMFVSQQCCRYVERPLTYWEDANAPHVSASSSTDMWNVYLHPEEMPMPHMCQLTVIQTYGKITYTLRRCQCHTCVSQQWCRQVGQSLTRWWDTNPTHVSASSNTDMWNNHIHADEMPMPHMCESAVLVIQTWSITYILSRCQCHICVSHQWCRIWNNHLLPEMSMSYMYQPGVIQTCKITTYKLRRCQCHTCVSQQWSRHVECSLTSWDANATHCQPAVT